MYDLTFHLEKNGKNRLENEPKNGQNRTNK